MKKKLILLCFALLGACNGFAQQNYYSGPEAKGDSATYICKKENRFYLIENVDNRFRNQESVELYKLNIDYNERPFVPPLPFAIEYFDYINLKTAIRRQLSPEDKELFNGGDRFGMEYKIDRNGNVADVIFKFLDNANFRSLTPNGLFVIEKEVKKFFKRRVNAPQNNNRNFYRFAIFLNLNSNSNTLF